MTHTHTHKNKRKKATHSREAKGSEGDAQPRENTPMKILETPHARKKKEKAQKNKAIKQTGKQQHRVPESKAQFEREETKKRKCHVLRPTDNIDVRGGRCVLVLDPAEDN